MTGASVSSGKAPSEVEGAARHLGRLADALAEIGFGEYVTNLDIFHPRRGNWADHRMSAPEELRSLIDLFLLGRRVDRSGLPPPFGQLLSILEDCGLVQGTGHEVVMAGGITIIPVFGRWLICQAPQANPRFYFGDDTLALLARLTPPARGRCLDLCSGPGTLAMHAAGIARKVVAVEAIPKVARLAQLNARLNRLEHRIEVRAGDLYGPVSGETFDAVIANPPMLPFPPGMAAGATGGGGTDGLQVIRRIFAGLPEILRPGGVGQIIGLSLSDGTMPLIENLDSVAGGRLDITVSVLSHVSAEEGTAYLAALVAAAAMIAGVKRADARKSYRALLRDAGAKGFCHLFFHARHRRRGGTGRTAVIDVSASNRESDWLWRGPSSATDACWLCPLETDSV